MNQMPERVYKVYIETLRGMTPEQKLQRVFEMAASARELFCQGVKKLHPDYSENDVNRCYLENIAKCYNRNY
jgi:hypothetical protein